MHENRVAVSLLVAAEDDQRRAVGAIALNTEKEVESKTDWSAAFEIYEAENVILAVGGPGGLYKTSVYPDVHTGAVGRPAPGCRSASGVRRSPGPGSRPPAAPGRHGPEFERIPVWYVFDQISLECLRHLHAMHPTLYQHRRRRCQ